MWRQWATCSTRFPPVLKNCSSLSLESKHRPEIWQTTSDSRWARRVAKASVPSVSLMIIKSYLSISAWHVAKPSFS